MGKRKRKSPKQPLPEAAEEAGREDLPEPNEEAPPEPSEEAPPEPSEEAPHEPGEEAPPEPYEEALPEPGEEAPPEPYEEAPPEPCEDADEGIEPADEEPAPPAAPWRAAAASWLQLLRLPNLFTVPGDPLAGFAAAHLAVGGRAAVSPWPVVGSSLLLYAAGLLANDYFDLPADRVERPDRPLPSGAVPAWQALAAAIALAVAGLVLARVAGPWPFALAAVLAIVAAGYNLGAKAVPILGAALMGSCRGLSFLLGAAAAGWAGPTSPVVLLMAVLLAAYIAVVTHIASREVHARFIGPTRLLPAMLLTVWAGAAVLFFAARALRPPLLNQIADLHLHALVAAWGLLLAEAALGAAVVARAGQVSSALFGEPAPAVVQDCVGRLLRLLLPLQAMLVVLWLDAGVVLAVLLLLAYPLAAAAARRFYAS